MGKRRAQCSREEDQETGGALAPVSGSSVLYKAGRSSMQHRRYIENTHKKSRKTQKRKEERKEVETATIDTDAHPGRCWMALCIKTAGERYRERVQAGARGPRLRGKISHGNEREMQLKRCIVNLTARPFINHPAFFPCC